MDSIFDKSGNSTLISRINKLTPESQAVWGKMNVNQMLSHCHCPIDVATGDLKMRANWLMKQMGKMFKNKILNSTEFKKNSPTAPDFIRKGDYDFYKTKEELITKVSKFSELGHSIIKNNEHPFFGKMSYEEWDKLQWMHLDHHLKQFGA
jgi:hypothetical protein